MGYVERNFEGDSHKVMLVSEVVKSRKIFKGDPHKVMHVGNEVKNCKERQVLVRT